MCGQGVGDDLGEGDGPIARLGLEGTELGDTGDDVGDLLVDAQLLPEEVDTSTVTPKRPSPAVPSVIVTPAAIEVGPAAAVPTGPRTGGMSTPATSSSWRWRVDQPEP